MNRWGILLLFLLFETVNASQDRIALVIGNSTYPESPLINPVNDATDVAASLQQLGFKVLLETNSTHFQMERAVREFGKLLQDSNSIGLFFYAGHGIQVNGKNYLIPVDADIQEEFEVKHKALDADIVMGQMEEADNDVNLLILDACRNNPFERRFRSSRGRGLAQMTAPRGTVIWYATRPGQVASDGVGRNSPFTKYLIEALNEHNVKAGEVIRHVAVSMYKKGMKQEPWQEGIWLQDFYFNKVTIELSDNSSSAATTQSTYNVNKIAKPTEPLKSKPIVTPKVEKLTHKIEKTTKLAKTNLNSSDTPKMIGKYPDIVGSYAGSNWHITNCPDGFKENFDVPQGANIYIKNQTPDGKFIINSKAHYVECAGSGKFINNQKFRGRSDCNWTHHLEGGFTTGFSGELQNDSSVLVINYKGKGKTNNCLYELKRRSVRLN